MKDEVKELREQTETTSRAQQQPDDEPDLVASIADHLAAVENGEKENTFAVRDDAIVALLAALDDDPEQIQRVGEAFAEYLDREISEDYDRSEIVRLAIRAGLTAVVPEIYDDLADAQAQRARENV